MLDHSDNLTVFQDRGRPAARAEGREAAGAEAEADAGYGLADLVPGSLWIWCLRMWSLIMIVRCPSKTEGAGTSHLKQIWLMGLKTIFFKPRILKHHIPEHPRSCSPSAAPSAAASSPSSAAWRPPRRGPAVVHLLWGRKLYAFNQEIINTTHHIYFSYASVFLFTYGDFTTISPTICFVCNQEVVQTKH